MVCRGRLWRHWFHQLSKSCIRVPQLPSVRCFPPRFWQCGRWVRGNQLLVALYVDNHRCGGSSCGRGFGKRRVVPFSCLLKSWRLRYRALDRLSECFRMVGDDDARAFTFAACSQRTPSVCRGCPLRLSGRRARFNPAAPESIRRPGHASSSSSPNGRVFQHIECRL